MMITVWCGIYWNEKMIDNIMTSTNPSNESKVILNDDSIIKASLINFISNNECFWESVITVRNGEAEH